MRQWEELLQVAESIDFREDDEYAIIWQFESSGRYLVHSLYAVVNNRGSDKFPPRWSGKLLYLLGSTFFYDCLLTTKS
jgi:hypothetical protein